MTNQEAKTILKGNAVPTFPLQISQSDWLEAMTMAAEALEKCERYKWHDLKKNPNDLPEKQDNLPATVLSKRVIVLIGDPIWNEMMADYYDYANHEWTLSSLREIHEWSLVKSNKVIAWKYIEPFERKEE